MASLARFRMADQNVLPISGIFYGISRVNSRPSHGPITQPVAESTHDAAKGIPAISPPRRVLVHEVRDGYEFLQADHQGRARGQGGQPRQPADPRADPYRARQSSCVGCNVLGGFGQGSHPERRPDPPVPVGSKKQFEHVFQPPTRDAASSVAGVKGARISSPPFADQGARRLMAPQSPPSLPVRSGTCDPSGHAAAPLGGRHVPFIAPVSPRGAAPAHSHGCQSPP